MNVFENRVRRRDVAVAEIFTDRERVKTAIDARMHEQRFEFRGKDQFAVADAVVERFDAEAIARQEQPFLITVPNRDREHPVATLQGLDTVERELVQQHLGIRLRVENASAPFEFRAKFQVIINLAIIDDVIAPVVAAHRLCAAREIDDA